MAIKIKFDRSHNILMPTFVLATKSGDLLGSIPARNIHIIDNLNASAELSFEIYKYDNLLKECKWQDITDFKLICCREYKTVFEISVSVDESGDTLKHVVCKSLGVCELSQTILRNIEINTEIDIERSDYRPTIFYNDDDQDTSLIHRVLKKMPHYSIGHVDASLKNIQRIFSFDSTSIYDALKSISDEINCFFEIQTYLDNNNKIVRVINAYDLESYCMDCGKRGNFVGECPECKSTNVLDGYGEDTTIFISKDNLADSISFETDTDAVKNCFKLEAGDDLMTATILNCSPNGDGYIWCFNDDMKKDMSPALASRLNEYDKKYDYFQKEHVITIDPVVLDKYNRVVNKYIPYKKTLKPFPATIIGYPQLMKSYYEVIDFESFIDHEMMPSGDIPDTSAKAESEKLTVASLSPVAVKDLSRCSSATATNSVVACARTIVDNRYQVKAKDGVLKENTWHGSLIVTSYSDDTDTYTTESMYIVLDDNYELYVEQLLEKSLDKKSDDVYGITGIMQLGLEEFIAEIDKYGYSRLVSFHDACQSCIDILIEQGASDKKTQEKNQSDIYDRVYLPYYKKLLAIEDKIQSRELDLATIRGITDSDGDIIEEGMETIIEKEKKYIQDYLNMSNFFGNDLWLELISYRREDTYKNSNYISDGLDNKTLFDNALKFLEIAKKEVYTSAYLQNSITATLKNPLVMKEFSPLVDHFSVGNWIRVQIDDKIYKLRLISYEVDYNNLSNLSVKFSDVKRNIDDFSDEKSIIDQATSMASSFPYVQRQASAGKDSKNQLEHWVEKGLDLTTMKIVNDSDFQTCTWDKHGMLFREFDPMSNEYGDEQLKIINHGLYITNDNWKTSKAGIGSFVFYNPKTQKVEQSYGVIADVLVGDLVLSEEVGIYNKKNSISIGEEGIVVTSDHTDGASKITPAFTVQKKVGDSIDKMMYIDDNGNLVLNGSLKINSSTDKSLSSLDDLCDTNRVTQASKNYTDTIFEAVPGKIEAGIREVYNDLECEYCENPFLQDDLKGWEKDISPGGQISSIDGIVHMKSLNDFVSVRYYVDSFKRDSEIIIKVIASCKKEDIGRAKIKVKVNDSFKSFILKDTFELFEVPIIVTSDSFLVEVSNTTANTEILLKQVSIKGLVSGYAESQIKLTNDVFNIKIAKSNNDLNNTIKRNVEDIKNKDIQDVNKKLSGVENTVNGNMENISELASKYNEVKSDAKNTKDNLDSYKNEVSKYLTFDINGLKISAGDSNFYTQLTENRLSFYDGNVEAAYITNKKLNITDAVIESSLALGDFSFYPESNGGFSIIKRRMIN